MVISFCALSRFPVFTLLNREFDMETGSLQTPCTSIIPVCFVLLDVTSHDVVHTCWWVFVDTVMMSVVIVEVKEECERVGSLVWVRAGLGVCPFFERCADEPLCFSIGFWGIGFCGDVLDSPCSQPVSIAFFVANAVIGHDALCFYTVLFEPFHGVFCKSQRAVAGFIR